MDHHHQSNSMKTPAKTPKNIINKMLKANCESPFGLLPNVSTPPSKFAQIHNPFEPHLVESLHLSIFSPTVFTAKESNQSPNTDDDEEDEAKFRWTIDDISCLKPAEIDENSVCQHVTASHDSQLEVALQEKIAHFFNEKVIAPSPMHEQLKRVTLIQPRTSSPNSNQLAIDEPSQPKQFSNGCAQTVLTLPPMLPVHIEDLLKPYFSYTANQQQCPTTIDNNNTSLYRKLFEFDNNNDDDLISTNHHHHHNVSLQSSPALSTGLSPIQFSPLPTANMIKTFESSNQRNFDSPVVMADLSDCNLSPIGRRSICRLNLTEQLMMSVDDHHGGMVVPDLSRTPDQSLSVTTAGAAALNNDNHNNISESTMNWDMEYNNVSFISDAAGTANTPHSKIFTSQRKRLSDSFKDDDDGNNNEEDDDANNSGRLPLININLSTMKSSRNKLFRDNITDGGYHSGAISDNTDSNFNYPSGMMMIASTPTKHMY